jgi:hypothetical protein
METSASPEVIERLVEELATADTEHTDVSIADQSGWALSAYADGRMMWENFEEGDDQFIMTNVPRDEVVRLFEMVAAGEIDRLKELRWERHG